MLQQLKLQVLKQNARVFYLYTALNVVCHSIMILNRDKSISKYPYR